MAKHPNDQESRRQSETGISDSHKQRLHLRFNACQWTTDGIVVVLHGVSFSAVVLCSNTIVCVLDTGGLVHNNCNVHVGWNNVPVAICTETNVRHTTKSQILWTRHWPPGDTDAVPPDTIAARSAVWRDRDHLYTSRRRIFVTDHTPSTNILCRLRNAEPLCTIPN